MKDIFNYKDNIKVVSTTNNDKVLVMNEAIFNTIRNAIYNAYEHNKEQGYDATAQDLKKLWEVLVEKNTISEVK